MGRYKERGPYPYRDGRYVVRSVSLYHPDLSVFSFFFFCFPLLGLRVGLGRGSTLSLGSPLLLTRLGSRGNGRLSLVPRVRPLPREFLRLLLWLILKKVNSLITLNIQRIGYFQTMKGVKWRYSWTQRYSF